MKRKLYIFSSLVTATLLAACGSSYSPPDAPSTVGINYGPGDAIPSLNETYAPITQNTQQIDIGGVTQTQQLNQQLDYAPQYADAQPPAQYQQQPQYVESTDAAAAYFEPQFASYGGRWVNVPGYGRCWQPTNTAPDWRPYMFGHWVYTDDYGWYWVSEEPFGWATYHYGRWAQLDIGWCWVPGRLWGPAWVTWQFGDGYAGWAPLPPVRYGQAAQIHPWSYCFVEDRFIFDRNVRNRYQPVTRNVTLINNTRNITRIENVNNRIVNRGVDIAQVEKAAGKKTERVKVRDVQSVKQVGATADTVEAFRPQVPAPAAPRQERTPPQRTATPQQQNPRQQQQPQPSPTIRPTPAQPQQQPQIQPQVQPRQQPQPQQQPPADQTQRRTYLEQLDKEMQDRHHKERETPNVNRDQVNKRQENEARLLRDQQQRMTPRPQQPQPQPQKVEPPKPQPQKVEPPKPQPQPPKEQPRPNPPKANKDDDGPGKGPKDK
jgi:hypothetical protein